MLTMNDVWNLYPPQVVLKSLETYLIYRGENFDEREVTNMLNSITYHDELDYIDVREMMLRDGYDLNLIPYAVDCYMRYTELDDSDFLDEWKNYKTMELC